MGFGQPTTHSSNDYIRYDELPYKSFPFSMTHPARLAGIAKLFNLNPPNVHHARILELGCASGGNLIPLSFYYPDIELVGIDYSKVQIEQGRQIIKQLSLCNVTLLDMSIADVTSKLGKFDYIIAHGLYSWISPDLQNDVLRICNENLVENGVAFISYNTYPGWKISEITRDAMKFHTRNISNINELAANGRGMIQFMHELSAENSLQRKILDKEVKTVNEAEDYYLLHEHFETENNPCYFTDFIKRAQQHALTYLAEAEIPAMFYDHLNDDLKLRLNNASNGKQIEFEQYLDFISNRAFRQTVLCHSSQHPRLSYTIAHENLKSLSFQCNFNDNSSDNDVPVGSKKFINLNSGVMIVDDSVLQTIFAVIQSRLHTPLSYDELLSGINTVLNVPIAEDLLDQHLEKLLKTAFILPVLFQSKQAITTDIQAKPKLNPQSALFGSLTGLIVSSKHFPLNCNITFTTLLPAIDGTRTQSELVEYMVEAVQSGKLFFLDKVNSTTMTEIDKIKGEATVFTQQVLEALRLNGHLMP